jgi:hypothetical protein
MPDAQLRRRPPQTGNDGAAREFSPATGHQFLRGSRLAIGFQLAGPQLATGPRLADPQPAGPQLATEATTS